MARQATRGAPTPAIPDKLYFRIGEVAELCAVETYVLRFWQTEFPQLAPKKSGTGQRLYRKRDVEMALRIKRLLHEEGYTIAGARQALAGAAAPAKEKPQLPLRRAAPPTEVEIDVQAEERMQARLERLRREMRELLGMLSEAPAPAERKKRRTAEPDSTRLFE
jgi:DNA-binding transcriptional MerR regulator